ncbi:MAG: glycosyl transferase family 2 [Acidocella sp. 20-57-95]|nr:MAG: glycosyl transferase family 2 [Acidocella sp. 20-57-95]OYV62668.1 MAG: glycosyl transferase family 2 [Acidocella sp. 21-58-7]HQT63154.1 glycosyltransferase family 2 protein [Acidocella sp.]HQU03326.1 glycosyltransferase family 2 protein [Acidocella sp.]
MISATHLVLIPSYNTGPRLAETVAEALRHWQPVWVVIDGSTDNSAARLPQSAGLRVIHRPHNGGKGAAVLAGLRPAAEAGFTHVLVMDADGQHPAADIAAFQEVSRQNPAAMILGTPIFDASAPRIRVLGRRLSNALARLETGQAIGDALFGFRVYPLLPLLEVMQSGRHMRGYDFDSEALVRLCWRGVAVINRPVPVRYFTQAEGGVSHFRYGRDNLRLAAMHARLLGALWLRPCRR